MTATHRPTYQDKVLSYLKTGHSLDLPKALALFGICRLSAAVLELRKKGYDIRTHLVDTEDGAQFSYYTLPKVIDKGSRIGTRVRITAAAGDKFVGLTGHINTIDRPFNDDKYPFNIILDGDSDALGFQTAELEPEYVNA